MRVLLLGEFSSLHKYLKEGLMSIPGIEVTLASHGDGWKKIGGGDFEIPKLNSRKAFDRLKFYINYDKFIKNIRDYDVIQIINPGVFPFFMWRKWLKYLKNHNHTLSLVAAGGDYFLLKAYMNNEFDYYIYDYDKTVINRYNQRTLIGRDFANRDIAIEKNVDIIIPSLYEYSVGYCTKKLNRVLPFPINIKEISYSENAVKDKIVIFHGLNREASKGTCFIRKAMEKLQENYKDEVEIIIDGHMPFDSYIKMISKVNVVVDQCLTYGYGINACISMAQGKVVMAPCRMETLQAFNLSKCPIIHIEPSVDQIYKQLVYIVKNKDKIQEIGAASRKYVEENHNYTKIARMYIDAWNSAGRIEGKNTY